MTGISKKKEALSLNRTIHEPTRLQILSYLAAAGRKVSFTELKEKLGLTAGNLSVQLKKLEEAGYTSITKSFKKRKPLTSASITRQGLESLQQYLQELEELIAHLKMNAVPPAGTEDET